MEATAQIELDGQYRALREAAGCLRRDGRGIVAVRGSEAADYLQGQLTQDVEALEPGEGAYAALLARKGRMQGDMRVLRLDPESFGLDVEAVALPAVVRHLGMYKVGRDAEVVDLTGDRALISVIGPAAANVTGAPPFGGEHAHAEVELAGVSCRAVATGSGVDLICDEGGAERVLDALRSGGGEPVSEEAAEIVRVEAGRPRFSREMGSATIPEEAGINDRAVSFTKGCYIGQETVARLHYKGKPNRHLRGLRLEAPAAAGDAIALGDREVGSVGTAVLSPAHGPIALAIVRREAEAGAKVAVGDGIAAEVVDLPF